MSKTKIVREKIWARLKDVALPDSRFHLNFAEVIPDFVGRLNTALGQKGVSRDAPLYFICRSGNRSRQAAIAATAAGYARAYNIAHGFEGRLDAERHRATSGSWKGEGYPWVQS